MKHKGFTLIELLVGLGVGTVILAGLVASIFIVMRGVPEMREDIVVISDMERAAHWLTRDIPMGLSSNLVDSAPPVSQMTVSWMDLTKAADLAGTVSHSVTYTWLSETEELQRNYDGITTIVGTHLTNVEFSLTGKSITISLTSSTDNGSGATITRTYKILMRGESSL